ncbi:hypothetical protein HELRODRAFT_185021 [Helobdella robusta]|uniref:Uncharacterized protein n=1 Tax=Helobdella robusta TaxID=6412 RepID=T1FMA6_HELRO|nr:hypothetical protein HELRODRAFT_185021 [Helobdella robusta]ESN98633.1 hypothetical protein HELRODRAFT_185021 [Helobdella robusta]
MIFLSFLVVTFLQVTSKNIPTEEKLSDYKLNDSAVERFRSGLMLRTVCWEAGKYNETALSLIGSFIENNYPVLHNSPLTVWERVNNYSLLYKVNGQDPKLKPYLLTAHLDVVPTDDQVWDQPPFDANIVENMIYARGAIDTKSSLFGILEAMELHLKNGMKPKRTIYLAFGHDEECGGQYGAVEIVKLLEKRNVRLAFIHDEGTTVTKAPFFSMDSLVACIGISEKGRATVELSVSLPGGHASMPHKQSSIGVLSNAISKLESHPLPSRLSYGGTDVVMFDKMADYIGFPYSLILKNVRFLSPLLNGVFSGNQLMNALMRTTTAITMFHAGTKNNVIATEARAVVDHRIHMTETLEEVLEHDKNVINDERVKMKILEYSKPTPQSCYESSSSTFCPGFELIERTLQKIWKGNLMILPISLFPLTDSRHYVNISDNIYRFIPTIVFVNESSMVHGPNERISIQAYETIINYFYHFIANADHYNRFGDEDDITADVTGKTASGSSHQFDL